MCGRFVVARASSDLVALFDVDVDVDVDLESQDAPEPSFNIAPTDPISVVIDSIPKEDPESGVPIRRLEAARWGLVPAWAKSAVTAPPLINARIESAIEKPSFKNAVAKRRTIVPASGYYEWHTSPDGTKTPYFIHLPGEELFQFAALYEWWRNPAASDDSPDKWLLSAAIVTRAAAGQLEFMHDRMPVFLQPELAAEWLDPRTEGTPELLELVGQGAQAMADDVEFHPVSSAVGSVKNNYASLIEPV